MKLYKRLKLQYLSPSFHFFVPWQTNVKLWHVLLRDRILIIAFNAKPMNKLVLDSNPNARTHNLTLKPVLVPYGGVFRTVGRIKTIRTSSHDMMTKLKCLLFKEPRNDKSIALFG